MQPTDSYFIFFPPKIFGPNWIRSLLIVEGSTNPSAGRGEGEESRQEDKEKRSEQLLSAVANYQAGKSDLGHPSRSDPTSVRNWSVGDLKPLYSVQWPAILANQRTNRRAGNKGEPNWRNSYSNEVHVLDCSSRASSEIDNRTRRRILLQQSREEYSPLVFFRSYYRTTSLFSFFFPFLIVIFSFQSAGRCPARKVRRGLFLPSLSLSLARGEEIYRKFRVNASKLSRDFFSFLRNLRVSRLETNML